MKRAVIYRFEVELTREINMDEFSALSNAILAQCEEVTLDDGTERTIGYVKDSDTCSVGVESIEEERS